MEREVIHVTAASCGPIDFFLLLSLLYSQKGALGRELGTTGTVLYLGHVVQKHECLAQNLASDSNKI